MLPDNARNVRNKITHIQQTLTTVLPFTTLASINKTLLPVLQSPSRRNSQMMAEENHGDTRGYITTPESSCTHNADNEYDSRNANYLSREDTAPRYTNGTNNFPPTPDNSDNNSTNNNPQCPLQ